MPPIVEILLVVVIALVLILVSYFMIRLIKIEGARAKEDKLILSGNSLDFNSFKNYLKRKTNKKHKNNLFTLLRIEINDFYELNDNFDTLDYTNTINKTKYHIKEKLPTSSVMASGEEEGTIYVYLPKVYLENEINKLALTIKSSVEINVKVYEDLSVRKSVSIGYCTYPLNGNNRHDLIENLSHAIYLADKSGGNKIISFSKDMLMNKEFYDLYYEIKQAIRKKEFSLYYQPIMNSKDNVVYGFETLIRWQHPVKGLLSPQTFMKMLESSGDINWISIWGFETIINMHFHFKSLYNRDFKWHINLSHRQLLNEILVNEYQKLISKFRFDASLIVLELTDFEHMTHHDAAIRTIIKLKNNGFKIAVDLHKVDYQLLELILKYKIDIVKINSKLIFEDNISSTNFIKSLKELASKSNITFIAQSVELQEELDKALGLDINLSQGYFFSKPLNKDHLIDFLNPLIISKIIK